MRVMILNNKLNHLQSPIRLVQDEPALLVPIDVRVDDGGMAHGVAALQDGGAGGHSTLGGYLGQIVIWYGLGMGARKRNDGHSKQKMRCQ